MRTLFLLVIAAAANAAEMSLPPRAPELTIPASALRPMTMGTFTPTPEMVRRLAQARALGESALQANLDRLIPEPDKTKPLIERLAQARADLALADLRGDTRALSLQLASLYKEGVLYLPETGSGVSSFAAKPSEGARYAKGEVGLAFRGWKVRGKTPQETRRRIERLAAPEGSKVLLDDPDAVSMIELHIPEDRAPKLLEKLKASENVDYIASKGSAHYVSLKLSIYKKAARRWLERVGLFASWMQPREPYLRGDVLAQVAVADGTERRAVRTLTERLGDKLLNAGRVSLATFYWPGK
jgi:hypothetical protein